MAKIKQVCCSAIKVFIDSDVIISSLLSQSGASHIIIQNNYNRLDSFVSNFSYEELNNTADKLRIDKNKLDKILQNKIKLIKLKQDKEAILNKYGNYTYDIEDAHIVAGAAKAKSKFLVTFNAKDYKIDKIYQDFGIRVIVPGELLQYLRSLQ